MATKARQQAGEMHNVVGDRGEKIAFLALTDFSLFSKPKFRLAFLGEKWASADFYSELDGVYGRCPVVLFQVKTSAAGVKNGVLSVKLKRGDVQRLARIPVPVYLIGVCERTQRSFVRSVDKERKKGISRISASNELTPTNLIRLHSEIASFWKANANATSNSQPMTSVFP